MHTKYLRPAIILLIIPVLKTFNNVQTFYSLKCLLFLRSAVMFEFRAINIESDMLLLQLTLNSENITTPAPKE